MAPMLERYFDNASTTPMRREALDIMTAYCREEFGNPGNLHRVGLRAKSALDTARTVIADSIGAQSKDILFTGSGTESNNLAVLGAARRLRKLGRGSHLVTCTIEHPSIRETFRALEQEGFTVTTVGVDAYGRVSPEEVREALRPDTALVSIMHANNVVGTIQPIAAIGQLTRERGMLFHCDASQSYGKIPLDVEDLQVDLLTLNSHKLGGPKGVGALYVRKGVRLEPLQYGGGQERGLRSATHNVAGIMAFAYAVELAMGELPKQAAKTLHLRRLLLNRLEPEIPGLFVHGHPTECLPTHLNISIDKIEGQALMMELDRLGFSTASGSACSSGDSEPSYVLLAMGKSLPLTLGSLRITLGRMNNEQSVNELADALRTISFDFRSRKSISAN